MMVTWENVRYFEQEPAQRRFDYLVGYYISEQAKLLTSLLQGSGTMTIYIGLPSMYIYTYTVKRSSYGL